MNKYMLVNADTDSIAICKSDMSHISDEERQHILKEVNALYPDRIRFEDDGFYPYFLVVAAKNYVLKDEKGKVKIKGSGLKASMKEKALKQYIKDVIEYLLNDMRDEIVNIYNKYVREIYNVTDMSRWVFRKTITDKILNPERTNEQKVKDALGDEEFQEGDKIQVYFDVEDKLKLLEHWNNDHNKEKLLKKLYSTTLIFESVIDINTIPKYHLKNHEIRCQLHDVLGIEHPIKEKRARKKKVVVEEQESYNIDNEPDLFSHSRTLQEN